jgi:hypothetical protein
MLASVIAIFLIIFFLLSPWLVRRKYMSPYQRDKLIILLKYYIPFELLSFGGILFLSALGYLVFFWCSGELARISQIDLSNFTFSLFDKNDFRLDDLGLVYSLSHWWNILFVALFLNFMRYLRQLTRKGWNFPGTKLPFAGYSLIVALIAVMVSASIIGGSALYGVAWVSIFLVSYVLTHLLLLLLLLSLAGPEEKSKKKK